MANRPQDLDDIVIVPPDDDEGTTSSPVPTPTTTSPTSTTAAAAAGNDTHATMVRRLQSMGAPPGLAHAAAVASTFAGDSVATALTWCQRYLQSGGAVPAAPALVDDDGVVSRAPSAGGTVTLDHVGSSETDGTAVGDAHTYGRTGALREWQVDVDGVLTAQASSTSGDAGRPRSYAFSHRSDSGTPGGTPGRGHSAAERWRDQRRQRRARRESADSEIVGLSDELQRVWSSASSRDAEGSSAARQGAFIAAAFAARVAHIGTVRQAVTCPICLDRFPPDETVAWPTCKHKFCRDCVLGYLRVKIQDGQVNSLNCPFVMDEGSCGAPMPASTLEGLVDEDLFTKYGRFVLNLNPNNRQCPKCDTDQVGSPEQLQMVCVQCQYEFCFEHGDAHPNGSCAEYERRVAEVDKKSTRVIKQTTRQCPGCGVATAYTGGCMHMTCTQCNANWCWLCGKQILGGGYPMHFATWNVFGCPGRQFAEVDADVAPQRTVASMCVTTTRVVLSGLVLLLFFWLALPLWLWGCAAGRGWSRHPSLVVEKTITVSTYLLAGLVFAPLAPVVMATRFTWMVLKSIVEDVDECDCCEDCCDDDGLGCVCTFITLVLATAVSLVAVLCFWTIVLVMYTVVLVLTLVAIVVTALFACFPPCTALTSRLFDILTFLLLLAIGEEED
eukprot:m.495770 g.495770  ORF g.495770 m.495770 type:complete len:669 (-) comp45611_c0_seq1:28-2034(-)